jgi:hypothetical protein
VAAQTATGFVVQELNGGTSSGAFRYRVVARPQSDTKVQRLAKFAMPHIKVPTVTDLPKPVAPPVPPNPPKPTTSVTVGSQPAQAPSSGPVPPQPRP